MEAKPNLTEAARELGRLGGIARAGKLSPQQRSSIARKAGLSPVKPGSRRRGRPAKEISERTEQN